jgi:hypothetical protein
MSENVALNIRYIGFESLEGARRQLEYAITARGAPTRKAIVEIPGSAFTGPNRVTFQESAAICYEKLRREVSSDSPSDAPLVFVLTSEDIEKFRPRRRAAGKKE